MGTHPIFESDFDCLTDKMAVGMAASFHVGHRAQIERPNFEPHQFQQNFQQFDGPLVEQMDHPLLDEFGSDQFSYGIGKTEIFRTETEVPDWAVAALGGNVRYLDDEREETSLKTFKENHFAIRIKGQLPQMTLDRASKSIKDMLFKNSALGIFISENSAQVKLPLKTTSTLNQLFKVSPFLDLDCFLRQNTISQKVTVNELSSKVSAVSIPFHVVVWLDKSSQIDKIYNELYTAVVRQVEFVANCLKRADIKHGDEIMLKNYYHPFSILPITVPVMINREPSKKYLDSMKESLGLPESFSFCEATESGDGVNPSSHSVLKVLTNVHEALNVPNLPIVRTVKGRYGYYHYGQQGKNDTGWGCAYRSLQTCMSWFYLEGRTDQLPIDHAGIQKTLVQIGDKQPNFMGSKEWIGSFEVQMVLNEKLGVESKIINVSSGIELPDQVPDLIEHFENVGSPVMIGGGVLAHTIVGVAYDEATRDCQFLILDPHYTGTHNETSIKEEFHLQLTKFYFQTSILLYF